MLTASVNVRNGWKADIRPVRNAQMQVTDLSLFISPCRGRRGRICSREDGRFQVVTETLRGRTGDHEAYWINDHPPSGIFADAGAAGAHLLAVLPGATEMQGIEACTFHLEVGPYPEPMLQTSG
jgi:hypothetical protein